MKRKTGNRMLTTGLVLAMTAGNVCRLWKLCHLRQQQTTLLQIRRPLQKQAKLLLYRRPYKRITGKSLL